MKIAQILISLNLTLVANAQMTDHRIGDWFTGKISQQKQSSLRFYGRHNRFDAQALTTQEIVDFDFRAESSGFVDLKMLEIESSTVADKISILIGELDAEAGEETLVQQAIEELQSIATPGDRSVLPHSQRHFAQV